MGNLKVLMMGGRRCGKTSALASLFDQMKNTPAIYELLTTADKTGPQAKTANGITENVERLNNKILEMKSFLKKYTPNDFLVDKSPTMFFWRYNMEISLAGTNKKMMMEFQDSAGEFFDFGGSHTDETMAYVQDCDVFVIVVDTPYLMCNKDYVADAANITDSIHSFLTSIDEDSSMKQEAKLVLFVPIKCEKWIHEGKINDVNQKIKQIYAPTIKHLTLRENTEVSIIPIETVGSIEFSELRDAHIIISPNPDKPNEPIKRKCSKVTDKTVILQNGDMYHLKPEEELKDDPESSFDGDERVPRPTEWFHHSTTSPKYEPQNCEQVALHILRFMLNKARKNQNGNWFIQIFRKIFGAITLNDLNNTIVELTNKGLIKDTGDGIERIKTYA